MTGVEVIDTRVEDALLVVEVRLSVNLTAQTLSQVASKMQRSHLELIRMIDDSLRFAGAPSGVLAKLGDLRSTIAHRQPSWFNNADHFMRATKDVLDERHAIFERLGTREVWPTIEMEKTQGHMEKVTELCAHEGENEAAIEVLKHFLILERVDKKSKQLLTAARSVVHLQTQDQWRLLAAVWLLVNKGAKPPWPSTVVHLLTAHTEGRTKLVSAFEEVVKVFVKEETDPFALSQPIHAFTDNLNRTP